MSEKPTPEQIAIIDAARDAWLDWHHDWDEDMIPMMSIQWQRAFVAGAKWMQAKGEK